MELISFIYRLLEKHVRITKAELAQLELEANQWYKEQAETTKIGGMVKKYADTWYVKTALAAIFIFASRWLYDFMNPESESEDDD